MAGHPRILPFREVQRFRAMPIAGSITLLIPGMLLFAASIGKLADLDAFAASLRTYTLLPTPLRTAAIIVIPTVEALPLVGLLFGHARLAAGMMILVLSSVTIAHASHWLYGIDPHCECFGIVLARDHAAAARKVYMLQNLMLIACAVIGATIKSNCRATKSPEQK